MVAVSLPMAEVETPLMTGPGAAVDGGVGAGVAPAAAVGAGMGVGAGVASGAAAVVNWRPDDTVTSPARLAERTR
jgi:hypothetical protein